MTETAKKPVYIFECSGLIGKNPRGHIWQATEITNKKKFIILDWMTRATAEEKYGSRLVVSDSSTRCPTCVKLDIGERIARGAFTEPKTVHLTDHARTRLEELLKVSC